MKTLIEEYGDVILAVAIVIIILTILYFVLPLIQETVTPFLKSVGAV